MALPTVFQSPQCSLVPDLKGRRMYANVDNRMSVTDGDAEYHVLVVVPTGLFSIMKDVLKVAPEKDVSLSVDRLEDRHVFSLLSGQDDLYDLWSYSEASLPQWILSGEYRART